jgi:phage gpG-like protein
LITVTVTGIGQVEAMLGKIAARMGNIAPVLNEAARISISSVRRNFEEGGRPPWKPLKKGSRKPLVNTGSLRDSVRAEISADGLSIGSPLPYAPFHQLGTRHIPARPFLVIQPEDITALEEAIAHYIEGGA